MLAILAGLGLAWLEIALSGRLMVSVQTMLAGYIGLLCWMGANAPKTWKGHLAQLLAVVLLPLAWVGRHLLADLWWLVMQSWGAR